MSTHQMADVYDFSKKDEFKIGYDYGKLDAYQDIDDLVVKQDYNDNGSLQILVTGIKYYRSEDVQGEMVFTSEDTNPFGRFQRSDGLY